MGDQHGDFIIIRNSEQASSPSLSFTLRKFGSAPQFNELVNQKQQLREGPQHQLLQWAQLVGQRHLQWLHLTPCTTQRPTTRVRLDLLRPLPVAAQPTMEQTTDLQQRHTTRVRL